VLKIRSKKLAQINTTSTNTEIVSNPIANSSFFDNLTTTMNTVSLPVDNSDVTMSFNKVTAKNEAFYKFNFLLLNEFKIITFFI